MYLTRPEKFKEDILTDAVLITQEATFKVQLDCDGRVHLTRPEESVLPYRQSDTVSYRAKTFTSLIALSWILRRLYIRSSLPKQGKEDDGLCEWKVLLLPHRRLWWNDGLCE